MEAYRLIGREDLAWQQQQRTPASHSDAQWAPIVPPTAPGDGAPLAVDDLDGMQAHLHAHLHSCTPHMPCTAHALLYSAHEYTALADALNARTPHMACPCTAPCTAHALLMHCPCTALHCSCTALHRAQALVDKSALRFSRDLRLAEVH